MDYRSNQHKLFVFFGADVEAYGLKCLEESLSQGFTLLPLDSSAVGIVSEKRLPFILIDEYLGLDALVRIRRQAVEYEWNWFKAAESEFTSDGICWPDFDIEAIRWFWRDALATLELAQAFQERGGSQIKFFYNKPLRPSISYYRSDIHAVILNTLFHDKAVPIALSDAMGHKVADYFSKTKITFYDPSGRPLYDPDALRDKIMLVFNPGESHRFGHVIEQLNREFPGEVATALIFSNGPCAKELTQKYSIPAVSPRQLAFEPSEYQDGFMSGYNKLVENTSGQLGWVINALRYNFENFCRYRWPTLASNFHVWLDLYKQVRPKAIIVSALRDSESQLPAQAANRYDIPTFSIPHGAAFTGKIVSKIASKYVLYSMGHQKTYFEKNRVTPDRLIPSQSLSTTNEHPVVARESFGEKDKLRILALTNPTKCNDVITPSIELRKQLEALQILDSPPADIADRISLHVKVNPGFPEIELASSISPSLTEKILPPDTELRAVVERADLIVAVNYFGGALVEVMRLAKPVLFLTTDRLTGAIKDVDPVFDTELLSTIFGDVSTENEFWDLVRSVLTDGKTIQQMHLQSKRFYKDNMDDSDYPTIGRVIKDVLSRNRVSQSEKVRPQINDSSSAVRECKMEQLLPHHNTIIQGYSESNKKSSAGIEENKTMLSASKTDVEKTNSPIFIGGMERSGTSMIRAVIGSHPDIAVYELDHQFWILNLPNEATYQWKKVCNQNLMKKMLDDFFSSEKYTKTLYKPDPERVYDILKGMDIDSIESYPVFVGRIFNVIMEEYKRLRNKKRWGFKSPWNEFHADAILSAYPDAKFLHVYRDVFSVSSSIKKTGWIKTDAAGFTRHTIKWNKSIELVLDNCQKYRGRYLGLNYDQFVLDPETYTKIICGFLNVRYDPVMLKMKGQPRWKEFGGSQTISPVPSQRPVNNLTEEEVDIINTVTQAYQGNVKERYPDFSIARMEARYLNELGEDFHSSGKDELAMIAFAKAAEVDPSYEGPFNNLGMLYEKQNDMSKALRYFIEALKLNSKNRSIVMNLGSFLRNVGKLNEAQKLYSNYLAQFPEDGEVSSERNKLCEISRLRVHNNSAIVNVSIIIPTHNRCSLLEKTIRSLVNQDFPKDNYEILVVDNGSTDSTRQVAEAEVSAYPEHNIRYIFEPEPGLHSGRHRGAREAKGEILCYLDDDVTVEAGWLKAVAQTFAETDAGLVGGKILPAYEIKPPQWLSRLVVTTSEGEMLSQLSLIDFGQQLRQIDPCYVWGCNYSVRRDLVFECGGFRPDSVPFDIVQYRGDGEIALSKAIEAKGYKAYYNPKACVYHYVPKERMTAEYFCKRQFRQGISDSFTKTRLNQGPVDVNMQYPSMEVTGAMDKARHTEELIKRAMERAYIDGFTFHQNHIRKDRSLLEWVLKENYFDCKLPLQDRSTGTGRVASNMPGCAENKQSRTPASGAISNADLADDEDAVIRSQLRDFQSSPITLRQSFQDHTKDPYGNRLVFQSLRNRLVNAGVEVEDTDIDIADFERWLNENQRLKECYEGYGDCFIEKALEHYLAYRYLGISQDDVYVDMASAGSPWANVLNDRGIKSYRLDLAYPAGINGMDIGADAANTGLPDASCSVLSAQCAYECFRGDADIKFLKESSRILNDNGRFGITPLYIDNLHMIKTSPYCNQKDIAIDPGAERIWRDDQYREPFSRSYSPEAFARRIYCHIPEDMKGKVLYFRNLPQLMQHYPGQRVYCFFMFHCEKVSSKTLSISDVSFQADFPDVKPATAKDCQDSFDSNVKSFFSGADKDLTWVDNCPLSPNSAVIYITERCNSRCRTCTAWKNRQESGLDAGTWGNILGQLRRIGVEFLGFSGGEPLLRPDLPDLVRMATDLGFPTRHICTNGLALSQQRLNDLVQAGVNSFHISLDGIGDTHRFIRGVDGYNKTINAIEMIADAGIPLTILTTLVRQNIDELELIASIAARYGATWFLNLLEDKKYLFRGIDIEPLLIADPVEIDRVIGQLRSIKEKYPAMCLYDEATVNYMRSYLEDPKRESGIPCTTGSRTIYFDSTGNLYPGCMSLPHVGNGAQTPIKKLVNSPAMRQRLKAMIQRKCNGCTCDYPQRAAFCAECCPAGSI